ncbi:MAG TPA: asparagine synthase-related protein [Ktedonobacteraceae bacterium]|jgi:asparagine synthetase B (glutamine-hydrolysing)
MPILAGWLTGEQVPQEVIEQSLAAMGQVLQRYGGQPAHTIHSGAGLIAFSDPAYAMQHNDEPSVLDWVPDRRTLVYRRPLSGMYPLYYIADWPAPGNLLFASEIKALLAVSVPRRLHLAALAALLRYGFIPAPWTIFKDIQIVPAGSILRWQRSKTVLNHATDYHLEQPASVEPSLSQIQSLLDEACANLLPPHEHLAVLTGGNSASALASILTANHTTSTFTVASIGYMKSAPSETWARAEQVAQACQRPFLAIDGVDQPEFWSAVLTGLEAPTTNTRPLALHQLLHTVSEETGARVVISGLGGRTLLSPSIHQPTVSASTSETFDILEQYRHNLVDPNQQGLKLWSPDMADLLEKEEPWEQTLHARKLARRAGQFTYTQQGLYYLDLHLRLPDLIVHAMHQLAVQERMVVRSPYLTTHVLDTLTRLPAMLDDMAVKEQILTKLVQQYIPSMNETTTGLPLVAPCSSLLRIADSDLLQQVLSPQAVQARGIFDPQAVEALLQQTNGEAVSRELLLVFTTQLFCQLFDAEM